jgi:hypothetical protein
MNTILSIGLVVALVAIYTYIIIGMIRWYRGYKDEDSS